ncbi:MAG: histidinol-phosphate transaminase [Thaumarchaeota archaeon]|nr:histidinol-phosphate transaminase [Nitrososphaerota archaeon]|tara:strand:- start:4013 stop:5101 length:1089 start_codon:yes stop_codon:yes gene_type:complete
MKIRKFLKDFIPYSWEQSNLEIANSIGKSPEDITRFDTNVSHNLPYHWLETLSNQLQDIEINKYPDSSYVSVRQLIADYCSRDIDEIILTNGADEGLFMTGSLFIEPDSKVMLSTPTYSYYEKMAQILGGIPLEIQRKSDFSDDFHTMLKNLNDNISLIILCNPNNPTGNIIHRKDIELFLDNNASNIPIIIDEAYFEYTDNTLVDLIDKYNNIIIVRTLSKAFGLAGLRVGYIISSKSTTSLLNKVRPPNSVGTISVHLAKIALNDINWMKNNVSEIMKEKKLFEEKLSQLNNVSIIPSYSNFMLIKFDNKDGSQVHSELLNNGIVVRDVSSTKGLEKYIRINIGLKDENVKLLKAFEDLI